MPIETQTALATTPQTGQTANSSVTSGASSEPTITSDFETFLLLLTTQLENQDPLDPIESQDFAVQLATFSGVEQQVRTNDLLESLAGSLGASDLAQLADWVGMEARVTAPVAFDGAPVEIVVDPAPGAEQAQLITRDAQGREVSREAVPQTGGTFAWVGQDMEGDPLSPGLYTLELASIAQGEVMRTDPVAHYARVTEARLGASETELVIAGGTVLTSSSVTALRAPE